MRVLVGEREHTLEYLFMHVRILGAELVRVPLHSIHQAFKMQHTSATFYDLSEVAPGAQPQMAMIIIPLLTF